MPPLNYLRTKLKALRSEYTALDKSDIIAAAGDRCAICKRSRGDQFLFGPTNYIKGKINISVTIDIHIVDGMPAPTNRVVMCSGCHLGYHLFNRLKEDAEFGKTLDKTLYRRCQSCMELSCRCCEDCSKAPKWCKCEPEDPQDE